MKYSQSQSPSNVLIVKRKIVDFLIGIRHQGEMMWDQSSAVRRNFGFRGEKYPYFFHRFNQAWRNERSIEIPIIWNSIKRVGHKRVLEVGNVLSHYFEIEHDVLDKYERGKGVINEDIASYSASVQENYDLIVSISTFEHIGWDEEKKEPDKIFRVLKNIKKNLRDEGKLIFTLPIGQNPQIDDYFKTGQVKCTQINYMKRINQINEWQEVSEDEAFACEYATPFPWANAILIGSIEKEALPSFHNVKI